MVGSPEQNAFIERPNEGSEIKYSLRICVQVARSGPSDLCAVVPEYNEELHDDTGCLPPEAPWTLITASEILARSSPLNGTLAL